MLRYGHVHKLRRPSGDLHAVFWGDLATTMADHTLQLRWCVAITDLDLQHGTYIYARSLLKSRRQIGTAAAQNKLDIRSRSVTFHSPETVATSGEYQQHGASACDSVTAS
jgi:hypothetical protein